MEKNRISMSQRERDVLHVMARVRAGGLTQSEAGRLIGRTDRQVRRLLRRLESEGDGGCGSPAWGVTVYRPRHKRCGFFVILHVCTVPSCAKCSCKVWKTSRFLTVNSYLGGRASNHRHSDAFRDRVLDLCRTRYAKMPPTISSSSPCVLASANVRSSVAAAGVCLVFVAATVAGAASLALAATGILWVACRLAGHPHRRVRR